LALRAEIVHAANTGEPLFVDLHQLPDGIVEQIGDSVIQRLDRNDPASRSLLTSLIPALEERLGMNHQATNNAWSALANLGRDLDDQEGRVEAIERVLASYDRQGRHEDALMATVGLAMAQGDTGDVEAALRTYESAHARAERIGRPELRSQVLRDWGLALKDAGQVEPAGQRLTEAVSQARRGADHDTVGRACVALGLFLQHEGRLPEARTILEEGLAVMDPVHPHAIIGRSHLAAVVNGRTCGCGDIDGTVADAFREFVITRLPADMLDRLDVAVADGEFTIEVELRRQATEAEIDRLNDVLQTAVAEFRHRLRESRYAG
jgi:tetratricopeptide (TPR) repeat protein